MYITDENLELGIRNGHNLSKIDKYLILSCKGITCSNCIFYLRKEGKCTILNKGIITKDQLARYPEYLI